MRKPRLASLGILAAANLWFAAALPAQTLRLAGEPVPAKGSNLLVAVLGHVERPGTYRLERGELSELIDGAGGLTTTASKNVRIIRDGRGLQKAFVGRAAAPLPLKNGDVVLAEGTRSAQPGRMGRMANGAIEIGRAPAAPVPRRLSVAVVGVEPWPIVWSLAPEDDSVQALLRNLNQPARGKVVLTSTSGIPESFELADKAVRLAEGMVVALPPGTIDRSMLPKIPEPTPVGAAAAPVEAVPTPARPEPAESPARLPPTGIISELEAPATKSAPMRTEIAPPPEEVVAPPQAPLIRKAAPPPTPLDVPPEPAPAKVPASGDAPIPEPKDRATAPSTTSSVPVPLVFVGASAIFMAILTALTWSSKPKAVEAPVAAEVPSTEAIVPSRPEPLAVLQRLEVLVGNRLPLVEEPVVIPQGLRLMGRLVETVPVRADAAQPVPEPHIEAAAVSPSAADSEPATHPVRIDRSHPAKKGLLDKALATVQKQTTAHS